MMVVDAPVSIKKGNFSPLLRLTVINNSLPRPASLFMETSRGSPVAGIDGDVTMRGGGLVAAPARKKTSPSNIVMAQMVFMELDILLSYSPDRQFAALFVISKNHFSIRGKLYSDKITSHPS